MSGLQTGGYRTHSIDDVTLPFPVDHMITSVSTSLLLFYTLIINLLAFFTIHQLSLKTNRNVCAPSSLWVIVAAMSREDMRCESDTRAQGPWRCHLRGASEQEQHRSSQLMASCTQPDQPATAALCLLPGALAGNVLGQLLVVKCGFISPEENHSLSFTSGVQTRR